MAGRVYCATVGCSSTLNTTPELSFFEVPSVRLYDYGKGAEARVRRAEWLHNIGRPDLQYKINITYHVCERHFLPHEIRTEKNIKSLVKHAIPSQNLPVLIKEENAKPRYGMSVAASTQTEEIDGPQKMTQPDKTYINPITTEINDEVLSILGGKVDTMTNDEKYCSIIVATTNLISDVTFDDDEQKLVGFHEVDGVQTKQLANKAMVVIARGIFVHWIQPVGYAFLSTTKSYEEIVRWIDEILRKLLDMGLLIKTFVSDMRTDFYKAAKYRGVSAENPYFELNGMKIYYVFDAPHLMKHVRDNLCKYDIHFQHGVAKNKHIEQFYKQDNLKNFKVAPKLTDRHIYSSNFKNMKIPYSTQVLSNSVAIGISTYIDFKAIDESGRDTVKFIKLMNDLFDALNCLNDNIKGNKYKQPFTAEEFQVVFFYEMLDIFRSMKLVNPKDGRQVKSNVNFIEGFQITIESILNLFDDLKTEGKESLLTRRLTVDASRTYFGQLRKGDNSSNRETMTSYEFKSKYRNSFFEGISKLPSGLGNGLVDTNQIKEEKSDKDSTTYMDTDIKQELDKEVTKEEHDDTIQI